MTTRQGDLSLLEDPVAQQLLQSRIPARLAYTWEDDTPRVVPIGFHWDGKELVFGTPPDAPKMKALREGVSVAATIDGESMPYHVLLLRGTVRTDVVTGIAPEYAMMIRRYFGDEAGQAWLEQLAPMCPQMARIFLQPTWVGILDFETRFPSALERAMQRMQA
jgi:Pyridoxamine 5'-phosphate oxidase